MTGRSDPITYVDHDPLIPTHLGTDAPHVHVRSTDRCLRRPEGVECPTPAELRAEVERLRNDRAVTFGQLTAARRGRESAEAERDVLQQRLNNVQDAIDEALMEQAGLPGPVVYVAALRAALGGPAAPPQEPQPTPEAGGLDAIEARAKAATPGPWHVDGPFWVGPPGVTPTEWTVETRAGVTGAGRALVMEGTWDSKDADAEFIAAADPCAVLALISRVRRAEALADEWAATEHAEHVWMAGELRVALSDPARQSEPVEPQPTPEADEACAHCDGSGMFDSDDREDAPCPECRPARQSVPVERITDAHGDETERGADTDTENTHQQDGDHR